MGIWKRECSSAYEVVEVERDCENDLRPFFHKRRQGDLNSDSDKASNVILSRPLSTNDLVIGFSGYPRQGETPYSDIALLVPQIILNHSVTANNDEMPEEVRWESDACSKSTSRSSGSY